MTTKPTIPATPTSAPAAEPVTAGAVARFQPPRLPYHPAIENEYGVSRGAWKALVEAVFPLAQSVDSIVMALSYCKARNLDVFKRPVHIVPIYDRNKKKMVDTIWPGISELRVTAFRTKQYAGADPATFGPMADSTFHAAGDEGGAPRNIVVRHPEWCQLTVYRMINGQRQPVPGPRVYWKETYSRIGRTELPNDMWQKRPIGQLEKCAESRLFRRAFPEEIGDDHTDDEVGARVGADNAVDITPRPTRDLTPAATETEDGVVMQYADEAQVEVADPEPAPPSPIGMKGETADLAWQTWSKWLFFTLGAIESHADRQALLDAHPKEWKYMQENRAADAAVIAGMVT